MQTSWASAEHPPRHWGRYYKIIFFLFIETIWILDLEIFSHYRMGVCFWRISLLQKLVKTRHWKLIKALKVLWRVDIRQQLFNIFSQRCHHSSFSCPCYTWSGVGTCSIFQQSTSNARIAVSIWRVQKLFIIIKLIDIMQCLIRQGGRRALLNIAIVSRYRLGLTRWTIILFRHY